MEPNKLENEFRSKFNQREINPSKNAWDRLDAMLTVAENEKPKHNYNWMYVAASIIGFLLIGAIFLSQTKEIIDMKKNDVVAEDNINEKKSETPIVENGSEVISKTKIENNVVIYDAKKAKKQMLPVAEDQTDIILTNSNSTTEAKKNTVVKNNEVIASIEPTLKNEIPKNEISNKKSFIKVDATGLLSQVDGELELSFREKIIKSADKNYKTIKVALANRNQE